MPEKLEQFKIKNSVQVGIGSNGELGDRSIELRWRWVFIRSGHQRLQASNGSSSRLTLQKGSETGVGAVQQCSAGAKERCSEAEQPGR